MILWIFLSIKLWVRIIFLSIRKIEACPSERTLYLGSKSIGTFVILRDAIRITNFRKLVIRIHSFSISCVFPIIIFSSFLQLLDTIFLCAMHCSYCLVYNNFMGFSGGSVVKIPPTGNTGVIPGLGRYPVEENGNPLQYSCLERRSQWAQSTGLTKESDMSYQINDNS